MPYHVGMQPITIRLSDYDYERGGQRAKLAGLPIAAHIRVVYKRELDGIDSANVIREELDRKLAALRAESERLHGELIEIVVALRDSIRKSNDDLLVGFKNAIAGKTSGQSGALERKLAEARDG